MSNEGESMSEKLEAWQENENSYENIKGKTNVKRSIYLLFVGFIILLFSILLAISYGAASIDFTTVWQAVFHFDKSSEAHQIILELRMPRIIGAAFVGSSFAVSGALMQGMTRNPLAESGLLGLNAGAILMLAICFAFFPDMPYLYIVFVSFLGAGLGAGIVFGIGSLSKNGLTPMRIILAGVAVTALFTALSEGISIYFKISQDMAFWYAGGVSGTTWSHLKILAPLLMVTLLFSLFISKSITILSLGKEVAIGLGENLRKVYIIANVIVFILAGIAVSIVGAVSFVGLIVPHIVRYFIGFDYKWIIPLSAIFGAIFVVITDLIARTINPPFEFPIGALVAIVGVPFFLYLSRRGGGAV